MSVLGNALLCLISRKALRRDDTPQKNDGHLPIGLHFLFSSNIQLLSSIILNNTERKRQEKRPLAPTAGV